MLFGSLRRFCIVLHILVTFSAPVRSFPFLSFIMLIFAWQRWVSPIFLKRSLVFPVLLFSSVSLHCSLRKVFLCLLALLSSSADSWVYLFLFSFPFAFLFSAFCKTSSDNHFAFHLFSFWHGFGHKIWLNIWNRIWLIMNMAVVDRLTPSSKF